MQIESGCLVPRGLRGSRRPLDPLLLLGMLLALSWVPLAGLDEALGPAWWLGPLCSVSPALVTAPTERGHTGGLVWFKEVWSECLLLLQVRLWVLTLGHCVGLGVLTTRSLNIYKHLLRRPGTGRLVITPKYSL